MKTLQLLVILLLSGTYIKHLSGQTVTVLTYNIYHGEAHYKPGNSNIDQVAQLINKYKPDFVALQEVDSMTNRTATFNHGIRKDFMEELALKTGMYGYFAKAIDYSDGGYGEGVLSKYKATPQIYYLSIPVGGEGRTLLIIKHTFPNGREIAFAGTHLCHEFEMNRLVQVGQVRDILLDLDLPVIVGGDFNMLPKSDPYLVMAAGLDDAALKFGTPALTYPYTSPEERLDYFFINKENFWKILKVEVIDDVDASDHKPVLMTLKLEGENKKNSMNRK